MAVFNRRRFILIAEDFILRNINNKKLELMKQTNTVGRGFRYKGVTVQPPRCVLTPLLLDGVVPVQEAWEEYLYLTSSWHTVKTALISWLNRCKEIPHIFAWWPEELLPEGYEPDDQGFRLEQADLDAIMNSPEYQLFITLCFRSKLLEG